MAATALDTNKSFQPAQVFRGHIPELDALRAFGITMVIFDHMWPHNGPHHRVWNVLNLSWILMDSFFVLSGFLIAGILLDSRSRPDYYRFFYMRRALRILPVYYILLTVLTCWAILFGTGNLYQNAALHKWGSPWWFFLYLGTVPTAITGTFPDVFANSYVPLWSLQIEEQFYLLFPLLVNRVRPQTLARTLLCLACVSPLLRIAFWGLYPANHLVQYVLLPCRMEGLALDAWIAIRYRLKPWHLSKKRLTVMTIAWVAVTCICGVWSGYGHTRPFNRTIGFLISSIACAHVVLWLIVFRGSRLTAWLRASPVQHLARISY
jgi:peptidoglycan/LPS O-acetylase OafA/YrhL